MSGGVGEHADLAVGPRLHDDVVGDGGVPFVVEGRGRRGRRPARLHGDVAGVLRVVDGDVQHDGGGVGGHAVGAGGRHLQRLPAGEAPDAVDLGAQEARVQGGARRVQVDGVVAQPRLVGEGGPVGQLQLGMTGERGAEVLVHFGEVPVVGLHVLPGAGADVLRLHLAQRDPYDVAHALGHQRVDHGVHRPVEATRVPEGVVVAGGHDGHRGQWAGRGDVVGHGLVGEDGWSAGDGHVPTGERPRDGVLGRQPDRVGHHEEGGPRRSPRRPGRARPGRRARRRRWPAPRSAASASWAADRNPLARAPRSPYGDWTFVGFEREEVEVP